MGLDASVHSIVTWDLFACVVEGGRAGMT